MMVIRMPAVLVMPIALTAVLEQLVATAPLVQNSNLVTMVMPMLAVLVMPTALARAPVRLVVMVTTVQS